MVARPPVRIRVEPMTLDDMTAVHEIERASFSVPWPDEAARVETGDFVADVARIEAALGWRPATALESGLREVIRQYRQMENVR